MDRLNRNLAACGLALALATSGTGCKSTRSEVPPSPSFSGNGQAPIGFNKDPNPVSGAAGLPGANSQYGTPTPTTTPSYGPPGQGGFGGVGSNLGSPATTPPSSTAPGYDGLSSPLGASNPATGLPQAGTGPSGPAAGIGAAPTANPLGR